MITNKERIQKIISNFGSYSRREVEKLIIEKRVTINNQLAVLGSRCSIDDEIKIDGIRVNFKTKHKYFVLNKPKGFISSRVDAFGKQVVSLIDKRDSEGRNLFTIGRLDVNTTGIIIITTDGELANIVNSPNSKIKKTYLAWVNNPISSDQVRNLSLGVEIDDGYITKKAKVERIKISNPDKSLLKISIYEGKQNQIKKMIHSLGEEYEVENLKRVKIGDINIDDLPVGKYIQFNKTEIYDKLGLSSK